MALSFHKTAELAALRGHGDDRLFNLREADLALSNKVFDLIFGNTELLGKFICQRNTTSQELVQVLRVQTSLNHGCAIEVSQIIQRY